MRPTPAPRGIIEAAGIGNELRPFRFEHFPDRLLGQLRMAVRLGVGDAFIGEPVVQLVEALEPQPRREEALSDQPDLILDLPLLPARGRRAGHRIDQVMAAHLQEAAILREQSIEFVRPSPSFRLGWTSRSYSKAVSPDRSTLRTVFRATLRSRAISLIVLPLRKCSRRIRPIVSTVSIPPRCLLSNQSKQRCAHQAE